MSIEAKIALNLPGKEKPGQYFSFRLREDLYNEPSEYQASKKIFVVSDIEGNFRSFSKLLHANKVVDRYLKWIFGDGHLVIVGDCFDRGEQVTECLWLIYSLEHSARINGGYVHFILGNHEIMNMNGDWRYVHPKYAVRNPASKTPSAALYQGNNELWHWMRTKNIIEKIGDVLFVHAGISPVISQLNLSLQDINNAARLHYASAQQIAPATLGAILFNDMDSPFWYRGYYDGTATEELVDNTLSQFNVSTIVTGHTIMDKVTSCFNNKVINIDTNHAMGNSEALLISKNKFYRMSIKGKKEERIK